MPGFKITSKALDDLRSIGQYTSSRWGVAQRNRYLAMLDNSFQAISNEPLLGKPCDDIKPGYRKYYAGRHLIFYRTTQSNVQIVRILHDSMDIERHF